MPDRTPRPGPDRSPAHAPEPASSEWPVWSTKARLVVTDPAALDEAHRIVVDQLASVDAAASRFRDDSEVSRLASAGGEPRRVSPVLAELIGVALTAAASTNGDVDPTLGGPLAALGYDRDIALIPVDRRRPAHRRGPDHREEPAAGGATVAAAVRRGPAWRRITLDGDQVTVPAGIQLDLGATAKAHTADRCAALVADRLGTGALVSLGGDLATAGAPPAGGWRVYVQDRPGEPAGSVTLAAGGALATSSTIGRRWRRDGRVLHHILDPRTCRPAPVVWRTVTVAATSCLAANTATTAALVRGRGAVGWLNALGLPARLVGADGAVVTVNGWPDDDPTPTDWLRTGPLALSRSEAAR
ncbi:FAD:protein FMN transferase [Pseudofrankia inefficax]|uniref:FAD:protein FMN transferase n=1 Tax=Pseudofrankia inefficax (strain DSM 45817 / CECT 9037 / DDB 130130 / EuI1c) TaxID=298654 RepID=E3IWX1_PSEI1|nr:FAD:protein FMN transferase [Pseudofrankia inefficax]ADP82595.1 ApbE family lipoprotein [Pseudofrankia inefficax]